MDDYQEHGELPLRYFQASRLGNGVGLTVLQRQPPEEEACHTLTIHVLPKFWREADTRGVYALPSALTATVFHTFVYEQDVIGLDSSWAIHFSRVAPVDSGSVATDERGDGANDPLWVEIRNQLTPSPLQVLDSSQADALWKLVNLYEMEPAVLPDRVELPPASTSILPDVPQLALQFYRQFLTQAEDALRQRKPMFIQTRDELSFVRGRMVPKDLVARKVYHRLPVVCEFDSLTADSHIWQTIRAAAQITGQVEDAEVVSRSVEIDAHLRDVGTKASSEVLSEHLSSIELSRIGTSLRNTYLLARSILARQLGVGYREPSSSGGVIANLKIVSSDLWEKMVARYLKESLDGAEVKEQQKLYLFYTGKAQAKHAGRPKEPDIILSHQGKKTVLDAKYKVVQNSITSASMGDQYQLATYSYRMDCDAFLVYCARGNPQSFDVQAEHHYLAPPGFGYSEVDPSEQTWNRVGVLSLPFPGPDDVRDNFCIESLEGKLFPPEEGTQ